MPGDDVPNFSIPADLIGKIDLTRPDWLLALRIDGIEVTQGIQWYSAAEHLTDPADRGPDNGVTDPWQAWETWNNPPTPNPAPF